MKIVPIFLLLATLIIACNEKRPSSSLPEKNPKGYTLTGTVSSKDGAILYLIIYNKNTIQKIDSVQIKNSRFVFSGQLKYPHKAGLKLQNHANSFSFILANENIKINLNTAQINASAIHNSKINNQLAYLKNESAKIFRKIDYLYPLLQKARIENNSESLKKINIQIQKINKENQNFLIDFINNNPDNYLSAMLLNDLWNSGESDTILLQKTARKLNNSVKPVLNFAIH